MRPINLNSNSLRMIEIGNDTKKVKYEYCDFGIIESPIEEPRQVATPKRSVADDILGDFNINNSFLSMSNFFSSKNIRIVQGPDDRDER